MMTLFIFTVRSIELALKKIRSYDPDDYIQWLIKRTESIKSWGHNWVHHQSTYCFPGRLQTAFVPSHHVLAEMFYYSIYHRAFVCTQ